MSNQPNTSTDADSESASGTLRRIEGDACCEGPFPATRRVGETTLDAELSSFKALANAKRLRIVHALREGELCACELETVLDAPQSTVASHLRKLRDAGIVNTRKEGKWTYYRIADTASLQLLDLAAALGEDR
ncbi:Arsenical resistance operon repressor [Halorubrum sp. DM2]|uniref:ArsR/SmtB family transcription factor n=1 Tax=unclassified Halorubrum TaxID=2642239 RepID=UPI0003DDEF39|nr:MULTISPECIES: metalloregulator ArsR/SmtB family transcription factor [unclassified Halorubrum]CDK40975.1 arsR family transcriptional regulator protein [Halorubrum sp. AJ67]VTT85630.1 Arsenical resistance operon repressor [Halorubrum sp. DM2]